MNIYTTHKMRPSTCFMSPPRPSVPATAATEDHGGQQTHKTDATGYATRETANGARVKARRTAASHSAAKLRAKAVRIGMLLLQPRLQAAPRRRRPLLAHQLRHPATGWAPRRRDAAVVAELEREASDRQREEFCAREHNGEHGRAAAQAARRGRAGSAHHLLQPCSLHALPASRRAAIDAKKPLNFPAVFACFGSGWAKVPSSSFFEAAHRNTKTTMPEP